MNVLVLGSGGREHAIAWKLSQSDKIKNLSIAPGNAGTGNNSSNLNLDISNFNDIKKAVLENNIMLTVVGPEAPLCDGIVDFFKSDKELSNRMILGPSKEAAQLEGSKAYAKKFMKKYGIDTAHYQSFKRNELDKARDFIKALTFPLVIKADGLAAGKGVYIVENEEEAEVALNEMIENNKFGNAADQIVIEEFLEGKELSVFVITDGKNYKLFPSAKDYKRVGEGDTGPNTGGMGAVSPVPFATGSVMLKVENEIVKPTIKGLEEEGLDYKGFLYFGLMVDKDRISVLEYNCRLGDPETQVVLPRLQSDLLELIIQTLEGNLADMEVAFSQDHVATVVAASKGYPGIYEKGVSIHGLSAIEDSIVFHAGTKYEDDEFKTNGGRVLCVTSSSDTLDKALKTSYRNLNRLCYSGIYFRHDIGKDLLDQ